MALFWNISASPPPYGPTCSSEASSLFFPRLLGPRIARTRKILIACRALSRIPKMIAAVGYPRGSPLFLGTRGATFLLFPFAVGGSLLCHLCGARCSERGLFGSRRIFIATFYATRPDISKGFPPLLPSRFSERRFGSSVSD